MKHKHYDMIVAKAANMELVVLFKSERSEWREYEASGLMVFEGDYFLCLPQHKEAVLHALNNGKAIVRVNGDPQGWTSGVAVNWSEKHWSMDSNIESRIKPKKEKRWVVIDNFGKAVSNLIKDEQSLENAKELMPDCSFHEIEVEV